MNIDFPVVFQDVVHFEKGFGRFFYKIPRVFILNVAEVVVDATLLADALDERRGEIVRDIVLRRLYAEYVGDAFFPQ